MTVHVVISTIMVVTIVEEIMVLENSYEIENNKVPVMGNAWQFQSRGGGVRGKNKGGGNSVLDQHYQVLPLLLLQLQL